MERQGLGDYRPFRAWSGRPRPWGPADSPWRVWFGGQVVDGLCHVLDELLASRSWHGVGSLAAIAASVGGLVGGVVGAAPGAVVFG